MPLTNKQSRFVDEYMVDLNATKAAIRSGYSAKSAEAIGRQQLRKTLVAEAIAERQRALSERAGVTAERVIAELAKIGFSDIRKAVEWRSRIEVKAQDADGMPVALSINDVTLVNSADLDDDTAAAIAEISQGKDGGLKIKLHDKRAALVDLGKHLGMFKERVEHSGAVSLTVSQEDAEL